jgi:WD40 repeat protein
MRFRTRFYFGLALSLGLSLFIPLNESVLAQTPAPVQAPAPAQRTFRDVPTDYWAHDYIAGLAQFRIISGFPDGTFKPDEPVTRAQFAAILRQAFLSAQPFPVPTERLNRTQPATPVFADVPNNYWARNDIDTARRAGFLSGYPGNQFKPNQPIPRVQALIAIANGLGYQSGAISELSVYHDAAAIPEYARPGIAAARSANIVINHPAFDRLMPNRPATRAEVAAFVYQALVKDGRAQPVAAAGGRWKKEPITTLPTAAQSFSFSADGQRLLVLTTDETKLQVWNTQTGALIREIAADDGARFQAVAIDKDGAKVAAMVASSSDSRANTVEVAVWEIETGQPLWRKTIFKAGLAVRADTFATSMRVTFSPDNQQIMTLVGKAKVFVGDDIIRDAGTELNLWNTANGEAVQSLGVSRIAEEEGVSDFAISPNGQFLAVLYNSDPARQVALWQRNQRGLFEYVRTLPQEYGYWWGMAILFRNDGLLNVMTRSQDKALLATWNPQTGDQLTKINLPVDFPSDGNIRLSPDGDSYFVAGSSGSRLGSVKTGDVQDWLDGWVAFSDRGNYLAVANLDEVTPSISIYAKTVP